MKQISKERNVLTLVPKPLDLRMGVCLGYGLMFLVVGVVFPS